MWNPVKCYTFWESKSYLPQILFLKLVDTFCYVFYVPQFPVSKMEVALLPSLTRILGK